MKSALLLSFLLAMSLTANAEDGRKTSLELLVGPAFSATKVLMNAEDNLASPGMAFGGRFMAKAAPYVSVGAELQTLSMGEHSSTVLVTHGNSTSKFDSLLILAEIKIAADSGAIRPFGIAGVGFHSTAMKIESTPQTGFVWTNSGTRETRTAVDSRRTAAALTLQGGVDFPIGDRVELGLSGSWYYLAEATYDSTAVARQTLPTFGGVKGSITSTALLANLKYKF
ncbi:MAG: outer membrane beta-barrel protein [Elusimicrobia bacterium]|nr:outer membrane beta-barrel protein [Elusimicrobiota bacterium]